MRSVTLTDVARRPAPGAVTPTSVIFLPDGGSALALLSPDGSLRQELVAIDTGADAFGAIRVMPTPGQVVDEAELSLSERLRRERSRQLAVGVTSFHVAARGGQILVPMTDGLWLFADLEAEPRRIVAADDHPGGLASPRLSDDGSLVAFVTDDEVHVVATDPDAGPPIQVTSGARDAGVTHGLAEYIAQEEMDRSAGFWLSPDADLVAFCQVDERHIPRYRIVHQGSDQVGEGAHEDHAYPFAGAANAIVRVGVVPSDGSGADDPVWLDLGTTEIGDDRYVARVRWSPAGEVWVQVTDRSQQRLDLIAFDPSTGSGRLVLTETTDRWINLHDLLRFLPDDEFLWASERAGFRHLEVWGTDGTRRRTLTSGSWVVTGVDGVGDEPRARAARRDEGAARAGDTEDLRHSPFPRRSYVWFTSTIESPLERHLCRVPLGGGDVEVLTTEPGVHRSVVHGPSGRIIETWSDETRPPVTRLHPSSRETGRTGSDPIRPVHDARTTAVDELGLVAPELIEVTAGDGETMLHGAVYRPDGDGPHPLIVWVYGGPHVQLVARSWSLTANMRAQFLRQAGYCVAVVDGRGSWDRGLAFEGAIHRRMGTAEVDDQVALVRTLVDRRIADPDRVGIYGWSYGGYLSALSLARRPDVFRAACAGAPVTAWDGYDTHYTERYMSTPADNPDGYVQGSVMTHVDGIADDRLLLIHGLIDENVHFRHTARLLNALNRADIGYDLIVYPDERHTPRREEDRAAMERRIVAFFDRALLT